MKNFAKKIKDFSYILPNSCFTEQLSAPGSEYTHKYDMIHYSVSQTK